MPDIVVSESAGGVVLNPDGQMIIVLQRGASVWGFPKGHIESGEDALVAARREIGEETGVADLALRWELGTYRRYKMNNDGTEDRGELKVITLFLFTTKETALNPQDPDNEAARWVSINEAQTLIKEKDWEFLSSVMDIITEEAK